MTSPAADEVHVWTVAVGSEPPEPQLTKAEAARFSDLDDEARRQLVGTRSALRAILGDYLDIRPREVPLVFAGKPRVAGVDLEFSVAHSGELALIAVARVAVGVDVERVEPIAGDEFVDLVAFVLAATEQAELMTLGEDERLEGYYRVWTRKEAYVKATGEGITGRPLPEVIVGVVEPVLHAVEGVPPDELRRWMLVDLAVPDRYAAALVARHVHPRVFLRPWMQ
jgi:4'-phosphopantetheinyl transferase